MEKILFIIVLVCFIGCNSKGKQKEEADKTFDEAIGLAGAKSITDSICFLDFNFGMTEEQVNRHFEKLRSEGKVYSSKDGYYTYDFHTEKGVLKTTFNTKFHNEKLCSFILNFSTESILTDEILMYQAIFAFRKKADQEGGYRMYARERGSVTECCFIKNNLVVMFSSLPHASMAYTNAPVLLEIVKEEKEQYQKTISDL